MDSQGSVLPVDIQEFGSVLPRHFRVQASRLKAQFGGNEVNLDVVRVILLHLKGAVTRRVVLHEGSGHQSTPNFWRHSSVGSLCLKRRVCGKEGKGNVFRHIRRLATGTPLRESSTGIMTVKR